MEKAIRFFRHIFWRFFKEKCCGCFFEGDFKDAEFQHQAWHDFCRGFDEERENAWHEYCQREIN